MGELKDKYHGKTLTTDEAVVARTEIRDAINELESIEFETGKDSLLLKWGTLKGWNFHSEKGKELLEKYFALGSSASAMMQKDTPEQKEIIYQLIDECDGIIQNDWDGEHYTKEQAKKYIREYDS